MSACQLVLLLILVILIAAALYLFLPGTRTRTAPSSPPDRQFTGPVDRDDERYRLGGLIYNNPDDPDVLVPKRFVGGWTVNFGRPLGKVLLIGPLLLPVMLVLLGALFPGVHLTPIGCHPSGGYPPPYKGGQGGRQP